MSEVPARSQGPDELGAGLQSLVRTLQVLFFLLRITIIVIFVWLLFSGVFFVDEQEEAMLFHFGKLTPRQVDPTQGPTYILTSGRWYWAWPYPIDTVTRIPAHKSVTVKTEGHFWPPTNLNASDMATASIKTNSLVPGQGGYLLTHDANIMHAEWSVTYRVSDAKRYYLNFYHDPPVSAKNRKIGDQRGMEALIRDLLENAALTETSQWSAEDFYRGGSRTVKDANKETVTETLRGNVEKRLTDLVKKLDLGIEIQQVNLVDKEPPLATKDAFERVVGAAQTADQIVSEAKAYEAEQLRLAQGQAAQVTAEAMSYRTRVVASLKADRKYFEAILQEFRKSPDTVLTTLYTDTISDVLQQVKTKYVIHSPNGNDQELRIQIGPAVPKPGDNAASTGTDTTSGN